MKKILLVLSVVLFGLLLLLQKEQAFTQDLGRHIKLGEIALSTHSIPKTNLFSYTHPTFPFINHHWGPEILFYLAYMNIGANSILVIKDLVILLAFAVVFVLAVKKSNVLTASILAFPFLFVFSERFDARPEVFSFLFLALFYYLLAHYKESCEMKYIYVLPVIELLWVNSHIYFFLGPLLCFFLMGVFFVEKKLRKGLVGITALVCLVTLINPNGLTGALYPLNVFHNYGYTIVENQNIFFLNTFFFNPHILVFELLCVAVLIVSLLTFRKVDKFLLLCAAFSIGAGCYMIRNFPLFVLLSFPFVAMVMFQVLDKIPAQTRAKIQKTLLVISLCVAILYGYTVVKSPLFGFGYVPGAEKAVAFFKQNNLHGPIFNNFDIGSFLIFSLYPQEKVFVDGRPEAYPAAFFDEYKRMQTDPVVFKNEADKYHFNTIFFAHTDITPWAQQFLQSIVTDTQWVPVYLDERILILVKNTAENKTVIDKYKVRLTH